MSIYGHPTKLVTMNAAPLYKNTFHFDEKRNYTVKEHFNDEKHRFEIHTIEWMESQQYVCNSKPEKINNFEVLWLKNGTGLLEVDGQRFALNNSSIHCIFPGNTRNISIEPGSQGYYISFAIEFLRLSEGYSNSSSWLEQFDNFSVIASTITEREMYMEMEMIVKKLKWEYINYFNRRIELLKGLLNIFMIYFSRNLNEMQQAIAPNREKDLVNKFISLMKKYFLSKKMVNDYANLLFVTPNYLNRIVKKITGFTASYHIQQHVILEAKTRALYSPKTMKQIAYELGFDNIAHFSKFFKNNCGMSFTDYKRSVVNVR